jgi:hypothetical protein
MQEPDHPFPALPKPMTPDQSIQKECSHIQLSAHGQSTPTHKQRKEKVSGSARMQKAKVYLLL